MAPLTMAPATFRRAISLLLARVVCGTRTSPPASSLRPATVTSSNTTSRLARASSAGADTVMGSCSDPEGHKDPADWMPPNRAYWCPVSRGLGGGDRDEALFGEHWPFAKGAGPEEDPGASGAGRGLRSGLKAPRGSADMRLAARGPP